VLKLNRLNIKRTGVKNMKEQLESIFQKIGKNKTISDISKINTKSVLLILLGLFIIGKVMSLFNFSLPGYNLFLLVILAIYIGLRKLNSYKTDNKKKDFVVASLLLGVSGFILICFLMIYPFIILSIFV
jgi:hypothetical protein